MKLEFKRALALLLTLLCIMCATPALGVTLKVQCLDRQTLSNDGREHPDAQWYTTYIQAHPDVDLKLSIKQPYRRTNDLMKALDKRKLKVDVLWLWSNKHNLSRIMEGGYCADLSGYAELTELVSQMYPSIQQSVSLDGKLYAVPISLMVADFMHFDARAWESLGLPAEEKPTSFTELLDFVEAWPSRFPQRPNVSLTPYWDAEHCEDEHAYTRWLVGILVRQYAFQREYLGQEVNFDTPEFLALLERCKAVGDAFYGHDGLMEQSLFDERVGDFADLPATFLPMRITDDDPIFIPMEVICLSVNAASEHQAEAVDFLVSYLRSMLAHDGDKPRPNEEDYELPRMHTALFKSLEQPLAGTDMDEAALARYRELTQHFYFRVPGGFDSRAGGTNDIRIRFSRGNLTAEQYVKQLNGFVK